MRIEENVDNFLVQCLVFNRYLVNDSNYYSSGALVNVTLCPKSLKDWDNLEFALYSFIFNKTKLIFSVKKFPNIMRNTLWILLSALLTLLATVKTRIFPIVVLFSFSSPPSSLLFSYLYTIFLPFILLPSVVCLSCPHSSYKSPNGTNTQGIAYSFW